MKSWKLVLIALIGAFTFSSSACTVTSDDDDNIGDDDDDFSGDDDDDDGDGGTGGFSGTGGTGGISGTGGTGGISGTGGTGGGTPTGTVTQFFGEPGTACRACLDNMAGVASGDTSLDCGTVVDACGAGGVFCTEFASCLEREQTEFDTFDGTDPNDILTCSFVACGPEIVGSANPSEEQNFFICLVDKCSQDCSVDNPIPQENEVGIEDRCPNMVELRFGIIIYSLRQEN